VVNLFLRQLLSFTGTLALVLTLVFIGVRALPGDAASLRGGIEASSEEVAAIRQTLGLEAPLYRQYLDYWSGLFRGDLGNSIREGRSVSTILAERLPVTVALASLAFLLSIVLGFGFGLAAGLNPNSGTDRVVLGCTTLGLTAPEFWIGFLFILLFAVTAGWFPLIGYPQEAEVGVLTRLHHLILPALTLAVPRSAQLARMARAQLLEERSADYVRTALSKGLGRRGVARHLSANALPPLLPLLALELGGLLTGTIIVEQVFGLPGLGLAILGSISARDYPVVQGITILAVLIYVTVNWLADLSQLLTDPRLRYG
jgi:ABC-type dipeptide/oligopeptide/nickel transport system permease component